MCEQVDKGFGHLCGRMGEGWCHPAHLVQSAEFWTSGAGEGCFKRGLRSPGHHKAQRLSKGKGLFGSPEQRSGVRNLAVKEWSDLAFYFSLRQTKYCLLTNFSGC